MDSICRAFSLDTSVNSSVTMPSPLAVSSNSTGGNQSVKRKANSRCEVVNDDDDDDNYDDVHQAVVVDLSTGDDGASFRRHVIPVKPTGNKTAAIWQHFKLYPSAYPSITDPSAHVKEWHKYAVCTHCYDRNSKNQDVTTSLLWDVKYGATHNSTSHLTKHLRRKHFDLYKAMLKKKVNDAVVEIEDNSRSCTSHTNSSQRKQPPPPAPDGIVKNKTANDNQAGSKWMRQSSMDDHLSNKRQYLYSLMKWIVTGFNNLDEVEDFYFREMLLSINPNIQLISRDALSNALMQQYQVIHYYVKRFQGIPA